VPPHPRKLLSQAGVRPKKRYGQNFLVDAGTAQRIARLALAGAPAASRIIEIGAGTGALTLALLDEGADVTALEIDPSLVNVLRSREDLSHARILQADALTFDYHAWSDERPWRVAGNLPYNVATALIVRLAEMQRGPDHMTVMVQKDVADRLVAVPDTRAYGSLSVAVQYAMHVERAFTLAPRSFYPPPKVHSTVVILRRRASPAVHPRDLQLFWKVVRGVFAYRRKTIANSLSLALELDRAIVSRALTISNLSPELRGERLDLADLARLADALAEG
jgi:16S rRNA (adenine1518-N6/adenine1519-N6)-dimethyltransferase